MKPSKVKAPRHRETLTYRVVVTDKNGNVLHDISAPSKSFVRQWNEIVNAQARSSGPSVTDTGGAPHGCGFDASNLQANAGIGVITYGLRVGTGSTAVTINDYCLETPLAEGVGANQLSHQEMDITIPATAAPTCSFKMKRTMINNSGATITGVRELGLYVVYKGDFYALGFRDVLPSAVYVPHGGSITVTYTIKVTV